ncbi:LOW QUALITY PROTEIN: transcription factor CP2-like protein 1 [Leptonychotes weddellii]|uniref:LOW QUALITY PROTEIN: transcription factor CP2-like protein 1 n=1 Tax=Leptonychotes weddellii TaxID=9713 RepID=A0A7F8RPV0_LEPWE|nr:LOW QUALITY PROTEIN: transcription factor CP2-like protein 1 [Leptonychotes weddellii]
MGWKPPVFPSPANRESLPLPYLKQEELHNIPSSEPPCPTFQYVLCAATSPAVKQQEETLTYLNQGQSYEVRMLCNPKLSDATQWAQLLKSVVRVVFHDRRLQYTEQEQLDGWRWSRPGDRILDIDVPLSVGLIEPQVLPSQLNTVEFHWDPTKRTSLFLQVHCISTEFTPRKKGGEKGVPFRLQIDTFKPSDKDLPPEHLHSAGCLIKVFKPKGADRKLKTDREKLEKQPLRERHQYQAACASTVFAECSPWPDPSAGPSSPLSPLALTSPHGCKPLSPGRLCSSPPFALDTLGGSPAEVRLAFPIPPPVSQSLLGASAASAEWGGAAPCWTELVWPQMAKLLRGLGDEPAGSQTRARQGQGAVSLLPRSQSVRMVTTWTALFVPQDLNPGASILETQQWLHRHQFSSYCRVLANFTGTDLLKLTRQDLIQICGAADGIRLFNALRARPIRHRRTLYVAQEASRQENEVPKNPDSGFYQEIFLDELSAVELMGKLAELLALPANQIHYLFHQGPGGVLILLSDQVVQNLKDESYFVAVVKKVQNPDGYYLVLT